MPFCSFGMAVCTRCARPLANVYVSLCSAGSAAQYMLGALPAAPALTDCISLEQKICCQARLKKCKPVQTYSTGGIRCRDHPSPVLMQGWRRVGNELGAGSAAGARLAMDAAALTAPALWLAAAAVLGAPAAQRALVGLFTTPGDVALLAELRQLLAIVMAMLLFDGLQTVLQGVVQARPGLSTHMVGLSAALDVRVLLVELWLLLAIRSRGHLN